MLVLCENHRGDKDQRENLRSHGGRNRGGRKEGKEKGVWVELSGGGGCREGKGGEGGRERRRELWLRSKQGQGDLGRQRTQKKNKGPVKNFLSFHV